MDDLNEVVAVAARQVEALLAPLGEAAARLQADIERQFAPLRDALKAQSEELASWTI